MTAFDSKAVIGCGGFCPAALHRLCGERNWAGGLPCQTACGSRLGPLASRPLGGVEIIARSLDERCGISHSFSVAFLTLFKAATTLGRCLQGYLWERRSSQICTASYAIPSSLRALRVRQDHAT